MITWLIWTIWTPTSFVRKRLTNLITYILTALYSAFRIVVLHAIFGYTYPGLILGLHSQWETSLQSNTLFHWLGTNLKSSVIPLLNKVEGGIHHCGQTYLVIVHCVIMRLNLLGTCIVYHASNFIQISYWGLIDDKSALLWVVAWCQ